MLNNKKAFVLLILFFVGFHSLVYAKIELHNFANSEQQSLYKKLSEQLRCLVCQNQNLADSNAELAQDMRKKTYEMVIANQSEQTIVDYWVNRYGDFVLYNPPFNRSTLILWLGPFFLLVIALLIGLKIVRRKKKVLNTEQTPQDAHTEVRKLLDS